MDQDQAPHFVGPELDPNGLQKFLADNSTRQRVNVCKKQMFWQGIYMYILPMLKVPKSHEMVKFNVIGPSKQK